MKTLSKCSLQMSGQTQKINRYISEMYSTSEAIGTAGKRKKECDWWEGIQF